MGLWLLEKTSDGQFEMDGDKENELLSLTIKKDFRITL